MRGTFLPGRCAGAAGAPGLALHLFRCLRGQGAEGGRDSGHIQSSGAIGAQLAVTDDFDLVLLDVGLPDIDGFEALNRLRVRASPRR